MAALIDRQVSGNEFRSLVGRTRPFNGPSSYQPDRRQCSGCRPSLALGELTLTAINRSLAQTTEARMAVSYAKCSGRRSGWCGQGRPNDCSSLGRTGAIDPLQSHRRLFPAAESCRRDPLALGQLSLA